MDEANDATLVAQARIELPYRTGAFEALMRRHGPRIRQVVRRFATNPADAEDLTQEVMLKVFFELPRFRGEAAFTTWLWRVTANVCMDHYRRLKARIPENPPAENAASPEPADPHDSIVAVQAAVDVEQLLDRLSLQDRMVVLLRLLVELDFSEIASAMGVGVSAAKMRYARAMDKLKSALDSVRKEN